MNLRTDKRPELLCPQCAVIGYPNVLSFSYGLLWHYCEVHGVQYLDEDVARWEAA